jgi:hypothetical protein
MFDDISNLEDEEPFTASSVLVTKALSIYSRILPGIALEFGGGEGGGGGGGGSEATVFML